MSIVVKLVRICLFFTAVFCASTFANERPSGLSLAGDALSGVTTAGDQAAFQHKWDDRTPPLLASLTVSAPDLKQEPAPAEPVSVWEQALAAKLSESSAKWAELQTRILADKATLAGCRSGDRPCPPAARRFLSIVELARQRQGRARLGEINRAINLSIRPMSDLAQYGVEDYWASPLESLGSGAGDCEDYAIAKYVALEELGLSSDDLQIEIVRDVEHQATHAVVAVRYKDEWLILDNRTLMMANADESPYYYLFALDHRGVRTFESEVARRREFEAGVPVSSVQDDRATVLSSNLAMINRLQKIE
jgi:predicted transglutaminase-like cysteine proteinase